MPGKPDDIPQDVWDAAYKLHGFTEYDEVVARMGSMTELHAATDHDVALIARAILAERERWKPAAIYFDRYCQDEADDVENCVCGQQQHVDAKNFRDAIRKGGA